MSKFFFIFVFLIQIYSLKSFSSDDVLIQFNHLNDWNQLKSKIIEQKHFKLMKFSKQFNILILPEYLAQYFENRGYLNKSFLKVKNQKLDQSKNPNLFFLNFQFENFKDPDFSIAQTHLKLKEFKQIHPLINGKNIRVGIVDTGIDGNHTLLKNKVSRFFNAKLKKEIPAKDSSGHGTHIAGIIAAQSQIGFANGVDLVGADALDSVSDLVLALDWMSQLKPQPRVINNSWSVRTAAEAEMIYKILDKMEALNIFMVFSAGNTGPKASSITKPHEHPFAFTVGAYDEKQVLTSFSSRGPIQFKGQLALKPDVLAPGEYIYSTVPYNRYASMSGTSMAAPFVTAASALILQLKPSLTPKDLRQLFIKASDRKVWDPALGYGRWDMLSLSGLL